jgi:hypothetical protein
MPPSRGRTSLACFIGALAAAPGSIAMLRASPLVSFAISVGFCAVLSAILFFDERSFDHAVKSSPS